MSLPRSDAPEGGKVPDAYQTAMARREEEAVVGAERKGSDGLGVALEGRPDGGVSSVDDLNLVAAGADEEGAVRRDGEGASAVKLLQRGQAPVVPLQAQRSRWRH